MPGQVIIVPDDVRSWAKAASAICRARAAAEHPNSLALQHAALAGRLLGCMDALASGVIATLDDAPALVLPVTRKDAA